MFPHVHYVRYLHEAKLTYILRLKLAAKLEAATDALANAAGEMWNSVHAYTLKSPAILHHFAMTIRS